MNSPAEPASSTRYTPAGWLPTQREDFSLNADKVKCPLPDLSLAVAHPTRVVMPAVGLTESQHRGMKYACFNFKLIEQGVTATTWPCSIHPSLQCRGSTKWRRFFKSVVYTGKSCKQKSLIPGWRAPQQLSKLMTLEWKCSLLGCTPQRMEKYRLFDIQRFCCSA